MRPKYRAIKKDYQIKHLENPFFRSRQAGKSRPWLKWLYRGLILLMVFLIWFFFSSSTLRIRQINISGLSRLPAAEIENIIWQQTQARHWLVFKESNIFLFQTDEAASRINETYNFAAVEVNKKLFRRIEVKISERPYDFIFQQGSDLFYASADGYILKETPVSEEDKGKYFILENKNPEAANMIGDRGRLDISSDFLGFIMRLNELLLAQPELPLERFSIDQEANTVKAKFKDGPEALFNAKADAASQIDFLLLVKKERLGDNFNKVNYIDLRYGERIYVN